MRNVFIDFESYYDSEYSLKKISPYEYVLDPRFEALGCSFIIDAGTPFWIDGPDLPSYFASRDWSDYRFISHNALFDMVLLSCRYGVTPGAYGCTLSMARNWIRHQVGNCSLDSCAKRYGMAKGSAIAGMKGISYAMLRADEARYQMFVDYGLNDSVICQYLYESFLAEGFPEGELEIIDWVIRMAVRPAAPKGAVIVSIDASQIEARLNAVLSGETWLVEAFRQGRDVYCEFAVDIYHKPITKGMDERKVGKVGILSLGYGSAWVTFQRMVRVQTGIVLADEEAVRIVQVYRAKNAMIAQHWRDAKTVIRMLQTGDRQSWGPLRIEREALVLPNGNRLRYFQLRQEELGKQIQWVYNQGPLVRRLYGAKVVENECQALAFVHIAETAMRVKHLTDGELLPCHQMHDELLYCVPEKLAEPVKRLVVAEMSKSPAWLPDAPLAAEGHIGETYGGTH